MLSAGLIEVVTATQGRASTSGRTSDVLLNKQNQPVYPSDATIRLR